MMERMNKSVNTEDVEPNSWEAVLCRQRKGIVWWEGEVEENIEESRVLQKCELQSDTESYRDPLKMGRGVAT